MGNDPPAAPGYDEATRMRVLNDNFRSTGIGGNVFLTRGIAALPEQDQSDIMQKVRAFDAFTEDNDPYREHDFGAFTHNGHKVFWKIDYYDPSMTYGSEDPSDKQKTVAFSPSYWPKNTEARSGSARGKSPWRAPRFFFSYGSSLALFPVA